MAARFDSDGDECAAALARFHAEQQGPSVTLTMAAVKAIEEALRETDKLLLDLQLSKLPPYLKNPVREGAERLQAAWALLPACARSPASNSNAIPAAGSADPAARPDGAGQDAHPERPASQSAGSAVSDDATLEEAIIEIEKTIRDRARYFPDQVAKKRLKPETAAHKLRAMRKAQSVLTFVESNQGWIRQEHARRASMRREAEELARHPDVAALLEGIPGATITNVEPLGSTEATAA